MFYGHKKTIQKKNEQIILLIPNPIVKHFRLFYQFRQKPGKGENYDSSQKQS